MFSSSFTGKYITQQMYKIKKNASCSLSKSCSFSKPSPHRLPHTEVVSSRKHNVSFQTHCGASLTRCMGTPQYLTCFRGTLAWSSHSCHSTMTPTPKFKFNRTFCIAQLVLFLSQNSIMKGVSLPPQLPFLCLLFYTLISGNVRLLMLCIT